MFSCVWKELPMAGCPFGLVLKLMKVDGFGKL
jgi:hypothetical protein